MYRRARPHGLAAGVGIQLACSGGGRYRALEMRYWRRAVLADGGATSDRGSHRHQCSEPHVGLRAPGVRPHRITRNTGRAQCVYAADPCNTVARAGFGVTKSPDRPQADLTSEPGADREAEVLGHARLPACPGLPGPGPHGPLRVDSGAVSAVDRRARAAWTPLWGRL